MSKKRNKYHTLIKSITQSDLSKDFYYPDDDYYYYNYDYNYNYPEIYFNATTGVFKYDEYESCYYLEIHELDYWVKKSFFKKVNIEYYYSKSKIRQNKIDAILNKSSDLRRTTLGDYFNI